MKKHVAIVTLTLATIFLLACGGGSNKEQRQKAEQAIESAQKNRDLKQLMMLADSFERAGTLSSAKAYYWRGYASDRMNKRRMAEFYWKTSLQTAANSKDPDDLDTYARAASRLANLLTVRGEYENALKGAIPAAEYLETHKCDTTSDYMNLLIYIGCCQVGLNKADKETEEHFSIAYEKHLANIESTHSDESYKDAIAGLINIAYACITSKNYDEALKWTDRFGKLLVEYEQRQGINTDYIDKQLARFYIYKAIAHERKGQEDEAEKIYQQFLETKFSQTPEGKINANEFLIAAGRWDEAAYNYRSLDAMFEGQDAYTIDNIRTYALKKYKTNLQAGRLDSALVVSGLICDSLEHALNLAKEIDAEEQVVIIDKIEQLTEQQAEAAREKQMGLFVLLGILFLCFVAYVIYRSYRGHKLNKAHTELKADYSELEERTAEKERTQTLQTTALDAQKALLPVPLPKRKDLTVLATLISGTSLSSDLYDYLIRDEQLFFCIGSAHGDTIQSSVQMAMAWSQFRTAAAITTAPGLILSAINRSLATTNGDKPVIDLFVGVLNLTTGQLDYSQAGSISPLLLQNDEVVVLPIEDTPSAGVEETATFYSLQAEVASGAMLYLYTPGVAATTNAEGRVYGEKRLRGSALQALKLNAQPASFLACMCEALKTFADSEPQAADQSMLLICRN